MMHEEEEEEEEDKNRYKIEYLGEKFSKDLYSNKIIFIGYYGVGKTSIIHKIMNKVIDEEYAPTMSIDVKNLQIKVNDKIFLFQIWDCCGSAKFALNTPILFKNTSIGILVYAINDKKSYEELETWYNLLKEHSFDNIIFLIGNKNDLEEERKITMEEGEKFKDNYDDIKMLFETSALKNNNIDKLVDNIAISIYEKDKKLENEEDNALKKQ